MHTYKTKGRNLINKAAYIRPFKLQRVHIFTHITFNEEHLLLSYRENKDNRGNHFGNHLVTLGLNSSKIGFPGEKSQLLIIIHNTYIAQCGSLCL